jgi:cholesterol transport system auxiliary component
VIRLKTLALAAALVLPVALGGCISLFPKAKPVQMYRFGAAAPAPSAPTGRGALVQKGATDFPPDAAGDHILTVTGSQTAYIAGATWVSPAAVMFDAALLRAFDAPGSARLVERGEPLAAPSTLRLDVRAFEARYPGPSVVVQVRATLIRNSDRSLIGEKMFDATVPAGDNRQGPIVAAFDQATSQVIADIRNWTSATAPAK